METERKNDAAKQVVADGYDQVAREYARLEGQHPWPRLKWLHKLLAKLEPGSAVLDLGCGSGDPAGIEIAKQHRLTGVDISGAQIALARRNVPQGRFLHADLGSVDFPPRSFAAVVSFYTLEHLPRKEHGEIFKRVNNWLQPGGYFLLSMEAAEFAGGVGEWLGVPMYFSLYDPETVKTMLSDAGYDILETAIETQIEADTEIPYQWVLCQSR